MQISENINLDLMETDACSVKIGDKTNRLFMKYLTNLAEDIQNLGFKSTPNYKKYRSYL